MGKKPAVKSAASVRKRPAAAMTGEASSSSDSRSTVSDQVAAAPEGSILEAWRQGRVPDISISRPQPTGPKYGPFSPGPARLYNLFTAWLKRLPPVDADCLRVYLFLDSEFVCLVFFPRCSVKLQR
jgi:hypothetical protein